MGLYIYIYDVEDYHNNFDYWINISDYMTDEEKMIMQENRPLITKLDNSGKVCWISKQDEEFKYLNNNQNKKFWDIISKIKEDDYYDNFKFGPGLSIYATFYIVNGEKINKIQVGLSGLIFDGVLYKCNNTEIDELLFDISGRNNLY